jgi:bacillithiol biosynthesis deacetylase BshB1
MPKIDILAIGVHPDDVELSCSGTLAKHIAMGKSVGILDLTRGELGTRGNAEIRTKESMEAARILGVANRIQLNLRDGFFEQNEQSLISIIQQIRFFCPDIVLCNAINDRHPDHGRSAKLVADACFYAGLAKIETVYDGQKQTAWRPKAVYHYIQDNYLEPDFVIDVTDYKELKHKAILAFSSQFYNPGSQEPETPISSADFLESVDAKMRVMGRQIGVSFAEGFKRTRYIGVQNLFDLV